jgi:DNA-binding transcriptional ArsR family regulator
MLIRVARAATTLDVFNAIAEPKRRTVLRVLADGELPVNAIVVALGWPQPQVSKHLGVLREVGLVEVRHEGRQRVYGIRAQELKAVHDWVGSFEKLWQHQVDRIKERAETKQRAASKALTPKSPTAPAVPGASHSPTSPHRKEPKP